MTLQAELLKMFDHYNTYAFKNFIITRHLVIEQSHYLTWGDEPKDCDKASDLVKKICDNRNNVVGIISAKKFPRYTCYTSIERDTFLVGKTRDYDFRRLLKYLTIQGMLKTYNQHFLYGIGIDDHGNEIKIYFK